ncbi:MAG TPA: nucleotide sugar dehydrogenase [Methanocorpusculum sp.]|nr:nucleotide sugar dehydrogenase [Methanocorpusculum sp.]HJK80409.1 nucleotide sugar dehydrogenase [Methanocorpusculum sp.]
MVVVFGLGFVGLTTALGFSEMGQTVYGIEANTEKLNKIISGKLPFFEPGLDDALVRHLNNNFIPTNNLKLAIKESEIIYYCVGTPYGEGGNADLSFLMGAIDQTLEVLNEINDDKYRVLAIKSTIPPSTCSTKIIPHITNKGVRIGTDIGVANNPEFLREGHCWDDFIHPDRVIIGVSDKHTEKIMSKLYENIGVPIHIVSLNTGEFIKYLSNTLLATLISYSNEMAIIADKIGGIDIPKAFKILAEDKRWNSCAMTSYVYPGCGYGGYCLPKDTNAMYALSKLYGYNAEILKNVISTNEKMPKIIVEKILNISPDMSQKIGILGLSFKQGSNDVRDSPALKIIQELLRIGHNKIFCFDPVSNNEFKSTYPTLEIQYCDKRDQLIEKADILVIVTAWDEFKELPLITTKPIVDCRYIL